MFPSRAALVYSLAKGIAYLGVFAFFAVSANAIPTVTVISPKAGISAGSPVFYEAYATSPACSQGIASMRIYTADHVGPFTVKGAHLETFIKLSPGSYTTVVQAWDNCGGVGKTAVNLTVNANSGVTVFMPTVSPASWPVHIAASAQNPACTAGINAIRIYTADGVTPYTIKSNQLNSYINLVPGTYKLTVQAWDNCGNVYKSQLSQPVTSSLDASLYAVNLKPSAAADLYQFQIASDGTLKNPNGNNPLPEYAAGSGADNLTVDPGGWFLYASTINNIYGYQINPANGNLTPMPGSPFPLNDVNNIVPPLITVDPSGNFLFARYGGNEVGRATTYRINRSSGALTSTGYVIGTNWYTYTFDFSGQYLYAFDYGPSIDGWRFNPNNGSMTPLAGSPYPFLADIFLPSLASSGTYLYVGDAVSTGSGQVIGFNINYSTGDLAEMPGSPFLPSQSDYYVFGVLTDWQSRFLWTSQQQVSSSSHGIEAFVAGQGGALTASPWFSELDPLYLGGWTEDHSGKYVFTSYSVGNHNNGESPGVASWPISANGDLQTQTQFATTNAIGSIAVSRQNPN